MSLTMLNVDMLHVILAAAVSVDLVAVFNLAATNTTLSRLVWVQYDMEQIGSGLAA